MAGVTGETVVTDGTENCRTRPSPTPAVRRGRDGARPRDRGLEGRGGPLDPLRHRPGGRGPALRYPVRRQPLQKLRGGGRHRTVIGDELQQSLGDRVRLDDNLGETPGLRHVSLQAVRAQDVVDGREHHGEVRHAGELGEVEAGKPLEDLREEDQEGPQDQRVGVVEARLDDRLLLTLPRGDPGQFDGEEPVGEVASETAGVDRGEHHGPAKGDHAHVGVGVEPAADEAVAGRGPAQCVRQRRAYRRHVVERHYPAGAGGDHPLLHVTGRGPKLGRRRDRPCGR